MTIIERLERASTRHLVDQGVSTVVKIADLAALLECLVAQHEFIHTQTQDDAEIHRLSLVREEAEKKVGLRP